MHLKSYKYSSVDKSFISRYILSHYVRTAPPRTLEGNILIQVVGKIVDSICGVITAMARAEYGHPDRVLFHFGQRFIAGDFHAGHGWTGTTTCLYIPTRKRGLWAAGNTETRD